MSEHSQEYNEGYAAALRRCQQIARETAVHYDATYRGRFGSTVEGIRMGGIELDALMRGARMVARKIGEQLKERG